MEESDSLELIYYCEFSLNNWNKRLEITFSNDHSITTSLLRSSKKSIHIELDIKYRKLNTRSNFFGSNILNVTSIIGKNGIGKSSILRNIHDLNLDSLSSIILIYFCKEKNTYREECGGYISIDIQSNEKLEAFSESTRLCFYNVKQIYPNETNLSE